MIIADHSFPIDWTTGKMNREILEYLDNDQIVILDATWLQAGHCPDYDIDCDHLVLASIVDPWPNLHMTSGYLFNRLTSISAATRPDWSFWGQFCQIDFEQYKDKKFPLMLENKFLSYNRKPYGHRVEFIKELFNRDLVRHGLYTLGKQNHLDQDDQGYANFTDDTGASNGNISGDVGIPNDISTLGNTENWRKSFLYVVTETTVDTFWVSEKTFKPLIGRRPFVHTNPYVIPRLKRWGFRTFSDFWDETLPAADIIEYVCSLSHKELADMYRAMKPILNHNHDHFFNEYKRFNQQELERIRESLR